MCFTWLQMNAKARLAIEEIYSDVQMESDMSFDFVAFVVIASCIAGLGLITNNSVMIVASMLVSPLMGPILSFTVGATRLHILELHANIPVLINRIVMVKSEGSRW